MHRRRHGRGRPVRVHSLKVRITIRPARADDLDRLAAIEIAASRLFAEAGFTQFTAQGPEDVVPRDRMAALITAGSVFVAVEDEAAIGFAACDTRDGLGHLTELDVMPEHGRKGIGRTLVESACAWAAALRLPAITLSTERDIPWNAPFYARCGFAKWPAEEWGPDHRAAWARAGEAGLNLATRVMMIRRLA